MILVVSASTLRPRISLTVSCRMFQPDRMMTREIRAPRGASREIWKTRKMTAAARVDKEMKASFLASMPEATRESDRTLSPTFFT